MESHQPKNYDCPFCKLAQGIDSDINKTDFIVYADAHTLAFVAPKWWKKNPGSILVVPKTHFENIYSIPDDEMMHVARTTKRLAIAIKQTYGCDGVSTRQHNEPAGNQNVWHYHVHVFPRYEGDELYKNHDNKYWASDEDRRVYAERLRTFFLE